MHTRNTSLNHIIPKLIIIRVGRDYRGGKVLLHNIVAFIGLELDTSN